jgi:GTP-binding protein
MPVSINFSCDHHVSVELGKDGDMSRPLQLSFLTSASKPSQLPETDIEVAFVGRSNVGKSSLINAIANQKQLARVSNTPGRTQLINLFTNAAGGVLVDLPGYGYAAVHAARRNAWRPMIEGYLTGREQLVMIFVLLDGEIGPTALDLQMLEWLRHLELPHTIVATKHDKVKPARIGARKAELAKKCQLLPADIIWVSASKGTGIETLRSRVVDQLCS